MKRILSVPIFLFIVIQAMYSQDSIYVFKSGETVYKSNLSSVDSISFTNMEEPDNSFSTFTDIRDGRVYKVITIGTQTWMAENLAYLPEDTSNVRVGSEGTGNEGKPYYYIYDLKKYGVLYNWYAAKTAAPAGWHLPSFEEWGTLNNALLNIDVGNKMKSISGWKNSNTKNTNSSGFSAFPGGLRYGGFLGIGELAYWWCSSELSAYEARNIYVCFDNAGIYQGMSYKFLAFSIRCVKDKE